MSDLLYAILVWFALSVPVSLIAGRFIAAGRGNDNSVHRRGNENSVQRRDSENPVRRRRAS